MFTLVPSVFFEPDTARAELEAVSELAESTVVRYKSIPAYDAVLVYSEDENGIAYSSAICELISRLPECKDYNKLLCSILDDNLLFAVAQEDKLLFANSFAIQDFTTAQYYIFMVIKSLQINPEVSTICFLTELNADEQMCLYRYFKAVEVI